MILSRNARLFVAMPIFALVGVPALILWGIGWAIMSGGRELWMVCHRRLRDPDCRCAECIEFDGVPPMTPPTAADATPPTAA